MEWALFRAHYPPLVLEVARWQKWSGHYLEHFMIIVNTVDHPFLVLL